MFIFPDLGGATPNHRLAFPGKEKAAHQKSPLLNKYAQQLTLKLTFIHPPAHLFSKYLPSYVLGAVLGTKQETRASMWDAPLAGETRNL